MSKIIAYLKTNWKHLTVAAIMALYNILIGSGVVPANYQLIINAILAALGISLTSNSGTNDAVNKTDKFLVIGLLMLSSLACDAQATSLIQMTGKRGTAGDTVTNTGTAYDSVLLQNAFAAGAVVTTITKISGTVSPAVIIQGSVDGLHWVVFGQDTDKLSNATGTVSFTWQLPGLPAKSAATGSSLVTETPPVLPYLYYRVLATGTGTMAAIIKSWISPR